MFKVEKSIEVRNSVCRLLAELDFDTTITKKFVIFQKIRKLLRIKESERERERERERCGYFREVV
jgi:hypothetical protein